MRNIIIGLIFLLIIPCAIIDYRTTDKPYSPKNVTLLYCMLGLQLILAVIYRVFYR